MAHRIEVVSVIPDMRAVVKKDEIESLGINGVKDVKIVDVYTIDANLEEDDTRLIAGSLTNPVFQESSVDSPIIKGDFDYAVEIGFLPGVTDNVGNTVREGIEGILERQLDGQVAYSSQFMFLFGSLSREDAGRIGANFSNPLIQRIQVKSAEEFNRDNGMGVNVPKVSIQEKPRVDLVSLLTMSDEELAIVGKQGIANIDETRRGPLALDLTYMKTIRDYFAKEGRNPTDVELESIAQTWSEHCRHTIFADPIDEIKDGLFKHYIRRATEEIISLRNDGFCVSVFKDNSGAISFDDNYLVTDKAETHNSPSALDPFGGAITGIVGVNRDAIAFGLGAMPIANRYGFCFGNPDDQRALYKKADKMEQMLSSSRIMDGVISGVNSGGNQSGIPTTQGFVYFDESFRGKPLVFVGTLGLIPREVNGKKMHEKEARAGDYIVMVGGRVGKDGIHGATFSSEAIDSGSPATAVQIGDPITQKKLSDVLINEARDIGLYNSITDNGAGGLSCSVAEMAKESGGFRVDLNSVPLKYPGLQPWEIWISESQERMTLAVPPEKWSTLEDLLKRRGVEATVIGEFTNSGKCVVDYNGENVMDLEMEFLHNGLPPRPMKTTFTRSINTEPDFKQGNDLTSSLHAMLARKNLASFEFISQQYDHEVQGGSVIKPLQGRGRVNGDATVTRPLLNSHRGVVLSHGINPSYSKIDTYHMAAAAIDTAVRNAVSVGARLDRIALMDNFCWCSSNEPERLGQLKRAVQACYDVARAYEIPFISGKDSMFNDFKGFDENSRPVKISIPPTLLASSIAVMDDVRNAVSLDAKMPGDLIYVVGNNRGELGGSEYFAMIGEEIRGEPFIGNDVPQTDTEINRVTYIALSHAIGLGIVVSAQSVHRGGLGVALAKTAMGGMLGMDIDLSKIRGLRMRDNPDYMRSDYELYSESQGRVVVSIAHYHRALFEDAMLRGTTNVSISRIGVVRDDDRFVINGEGRRVVDTSVQALLESYKSTFKGY